MQRDLSFLKGHDLAVYSTQWCPDCTRLRRFFDQNGVVYREVGIDDDDNAAEKLERETGKRGVPYILLDGERWVRGYHRELAARFDPKLLDAELRAALEA